MATEKQRTAMTIFQKFLEFLLDLFKTHHAKDLEATASAKEQ